MNLRPFALAIAALALCLNKSAAAVVTNSPVADTYFEGYGNEDKNFGLAPVLRMDQWNGRQIFLRFDLSQVPTNRWLAEARLRLFIRELGQNDQGEFPELKTCVAVYDVSTRWAEEALTLRTPDGTGQWNHGPGLRGQGYSDVGPLKKADYGERLALTHVAFEPRTLAPGEWLEVDISKLTRETQMVGGTNLNLLLRSSTLGLNYTFASRESEKPEQRPQLVLRTSDALPSIAPQGTLVLDWNEGVATELPLMIPATTLSGLAVSARIAQAAPGSRMAGSALSYENGNLWFKADQPGSYKVRVRLDAGDERAEITNEVHLLRVAAHPRLYVSAGSLERIRQMALDGTRLTTAWLKWVDNGSAGAKKGAFHDMGPHEGCENSSLAWLITGRETYLSNAFAYAELILAKPMREHFDNVHSATFAGAAWVHAMALHYDWCFDHLSPEQKLRIRDWLKEAATWAWARSSAPIAHNDGGARQCLLGIVAFALLRDDPDAELLYRRAVQNYEQKLLPWLNDGGQGGRSGDGGEYEGLHAFYIVRYAWLAHTATGEDVFLSSPFYANRLNHVLFGWYPRKLIERNGAFAMRQYYSPSGDHIRMGYVGDTQPYQSAAALCARFAETPEAQGVRWLAGEWPTSWMQYTLRWAVLGGFESLPAREPRELAFLDRGCNTVYARSDWGDDATWILFENSPYVSAHGSLDSGTFEIFKGDLLAARTGNLDHANVGAAHSMNYLHRTIAGNCLLINDPKEKWKGFLGGATGGNDGGGQRTNFPLGASPEAEDYLLYRALFQRGQISRFENQPTFTYAKADLAPAYNNTTFHGGNLNRPKVRSVTRELVYLRTLDAVAVYDHVVSTSPAFEQRWLLHSLGDLDVLDGRETTVDDGESRHEGATRAVIRYGWPKPQPSFGRCLSVTLLPENAVLTRIGGREDLPFGQKESWRGDQWHGQHQHRHIKDFWVNGTNYPPGNPPETRWFGEPTSPHFVPGTPDESGGRGKWRLEVMAPKPSSDQEFLHVLIPRLGKEGDFPKVSSLQAKGLAGAYIEQGPMRTAVLFLRVQGPLEFTVDLPSEAGEMIVFGLPQGAYVSKRKGGIVALQVSANGVLYVPSASGHVEIRKE